MGRKLWSKAVLGAVFFLWIGSGAGASDSGAEDLPSPRFNATCEIPFPLETILHISAYLPERDYKALADTCSYMHSNLLNKEILLHRLKYIAKAHLADLRVKHMIKAFNELWAAGGGIPQRIAETQMFDGEYVSDIRSLWATVFLHYKWLKFYADPYEGQYLCRSDYFDMGEQKIKVGYAHLVLPVLSTLDTSVSKYESMQLLFYLHALGRCINLKPEESSRSFLEAIRDVLSQFDPNNMDLCFQDGWVNKHRMLVVYRAPPNILERVEQHLLYEDGRLP